MTKNKMWRRRLIQLVIFLVLFMVAELALRLYGMKPGTLIDDFGVEQHPQYMQRFTSDEKGINHIFPNAETLMLGTVINGQGFRGSFDFVPATLDSIRKYTGRKIIMLVGDSYVEGCCADTMKNSFPDLLSKKPDYEILNFGVAGTDPLQYRLVVEKYAPVLKPDVVVTVMYYGNDFISFDREPCPDAPLTFPFRKNKWIFGVAPDHLSKKEHYNFKSPEEAYTFYLNNYTLKGTNRGWLTHAMSYSVILTKLYLLIEHRIKLKEWEHMNKGRTWDIYKPTYKNLSRIRTCCDSLHIKCLFVGIPAPGECQEGKTLVNKYAPYFKDIQVTTPLNLTGSDYDGGGLENHFNNAGHKKYAVFLDSLLKPER